jgi:hypothetical protein
MRRLRYSFLALAISVSFVGETLLLPTPSAEAKKRRAKRARPPAKKKTKAAAPTPPATPPPVDEDAPASAGSPDASPGFRGPARIDFDDRLIQGQTNQSGAVYLFDRKETGITSMVNRRKSFRNLTIQTVYDR